jgi:hypothetical protein
MSTLVKVQPKGQMTIPRLAIRHAPSGPSRPLPGWFGGPHLGGSYRSSFRPPADGALGVAGLETWAGMLAASPL